LKGDSLSRQIETNQTISLRAEFDDTKSTTFPANTYQHQVLQSKVISKGEIIQDTRSLKERRDYYLENLDAFNPTQTRLINPHFYKVDISDNLYDLKNKLITSLIEEIKKLNENE
jgi:nicotinate phosphoribosyltransferase